MSHLELAKTLLTRFKVFNKASKTVLERCQMSKSTRSKRPVINAVRRSWENLLKRKQEFLFIYLFLFLFCFSLVCEYKMKKWVAVFFRFCEIRLTVVYVVCMCLYVVLLDPFLKRRGQDGERRFSSPSSFLSFLLFSFFSFRFPRKQSMAVSTDISYVGNFFYFYFFREGVYFINIR